MLPSSTVLPCDGDASPHEWVWLTVVPLLPHTLEGVRIFLSLAQKSRVERLPVVGRRGVLSAVLVDPDDLRPPLDGDVGRLEAEALDQDRPRWSFLRPGDGGERQARSAHEPQRPQLQEFFARNRHAVSSSFSSTEKQPST
jgi:hypothetical protein